MELIFPEGTNEVLNVKESGCLGAAGRVHSFPETRTPEGAAYRLDRLCPASAVKSEKYYVGGKVKEGFCGAYYPGKGIVYSVRYDKDKLPYLGFWITEGGFRGDYNCALEPANGFYDSVETAQRNGSVCIVKKGGELDFDISIKLSRK